MAEPEPVTEAATGSSVDEITEDEFVIGHLYGGILSSSPSAFTDNQTNLTSADPSIYEIKLVKNPLLSSSTIDGRNPFAMQVNPNPTSGDTIQIQFTMPYQTTINYMVSTLDGKIIEEGEIEEGVVGKNTMAFELNKAKGQMVIITFIFDHKYYVSQKVIRK